MRCRTSLSHANGSTLLSFAVAIREQMPDDAALIKETGEGWSARERIPNGLCEPTRWWNVAELHLEPDLHRIYKRQRFCLLPPSDRRTSNHG